MPGRATVSLLVVAALGSGCASVSPEARAALRQPGALSLLRAPPPTTLVARPVGAEHEGEALLAQGLAMGLLAALSSAGPNLNTLPQATALQVPVSVTTSLGTNPSDLLGLAVREQLLALGYAAPEPLPGLMVRFDGQPNELPAGVAAPTPWVLRAQIDRVRLDGGAAPRALQGSASLYEQRRAIAHTRCATRLEAQPGSAEEAWLQLLRACAAELLRPLEVKPR